MSVARPSNAGTGITAIANVRNAYVNVRNGPGIQYSDIGDIRNNTLVVYYPNAKTSDNWYYVEARGLSGWVYGEVIQFESVVTTGTNTGDDPTPYDGKVAIWHWKSDVVSERTLDQFAANIKSQTPNVKAVFVKTSDGNAWQGNFDTGSFAINGVADVDRWVSTLSKYGLEFHAWCLNKGVDVNGEANIISAVCQRPGVKSMILDVEPYSGYWEGGTEAVRPLMVQIRRAVGGSFHIGMSVDPREQHFARIFPQEWFPFVNSIHPQSYWNTFGRPVEDVLEEVYRVWGGYGRPIYPVLHGSAPITEQAEAHSLATGRHGAQGLSWWRYGIISQWTVINRTVQLNPNTPDPPTTSYADERIIVPQRNGYRSGTYTGRQEFKTFKGTWGWDVPYKETEVATSTVWAEWKTELPESGLYEISVFVSARHATTQRARYKVHGVKGTNTEVVIEINQWRNRNQWVPLGVFELVKGAPNAGKVFLNDVTGEADREIAFDAVRFRRVIITTTPEPSDPSTGNPIPPIINGIYVADGFDSPVGTEAQRGSTQLWPSGWRDASPFAKLYFIGTPSEAYHTGADLNYGSGPYDDRGLPVYSPASGIVTTQTSLPGWGNVTVIKHDPLKGVNGRVVYSRIAHMQNVIVRVGQRVKRGEQVGQVGSGDGRFIPHLHYDISPTNILETKPEHWPRTNLTDLLNNYVDPLIFTRNNRP
jgi:murein DD-endopeptidase MepM/ murein hydrolase activator NlpD